MTNGPRPTPAPGSGTGPHRNAAPRRGRSTRADTRSVAAARGSGRAHAGTVTAIAVVVVLAVVVFGGILLLRPDTSTAAAAIPPVTVANSAPASVAADGTVVLGQPRAPHTLEVYEDPLCPICGQFEHANGADIRSAVDAGRVQVRYHLLNLLEARSNPPGYSLAASNALICSAENGAFPSYHDSLFATQPEEGAAGYADDQLAALGAAVGTGPGFGDCVHSARHDPQIRAQLSAAENDPALLQDSGSGPSFGTPTVLADGRVAAPDSPQLAAALH